MLSISVDFLKSIRIINGIAIACAQGILYQALNVDVALAIVFTFMLTAAGYLQNNLLDFELDTIGKKRVNLFLNQYFYFAHYVVQVVFLVAIFSSIYFFWEEKNIHGYMILINVALLYLYNCYLKKIAFIGNLAVAILSTNAILYIFWLDGHLNCANYLFLGFIFVLSLLREIVKDIEDKEVDIQYGYQTLPILLPINQIKIVTVLLSLATFYLLIGLDIPVWGKGLVASLLLLQSIFTFKNRNSQASLVLKVVFFVGILMLGVKG